ncbi:MAG: hypothetical protein WBI40_09980 [Methylococcaceae bacterium]
MQFIQTKRIPVFLATMFLSSLVFADDIEKSWTDAITVSGYAKITAEAVNEAPTSFALDDLSIFVSGKFNRWFNPFLEAEAYNMNIWKESDGFQFNNVHFAIERLYNDMQLTDDDTLRVGKMLASINHWNIVHAAPLVWTSTRPVTSNYARANYVTGLQLRHDFDALSGHALEVYVQPVEDFNHKVLSSHERQYETIAGARWIAHEDLDYYVGVAFQHAQVAHSDEMRNSISIDGNWQHEFFELESELLFTNINTKEVRQHGNDWGGYVQMAVPIIDKFSLITRYEHFEFAEKTEAMNAELGGIVYRPVPSVSFKLEWQQTQGSTSHNQTGLYSSVAVLF